jgi:hypothetical protein
LVQALGINASSLLHPMIQRFPLDEDSVFLLCSDGLSDNNLVDQYWHLELLPILTGEVDLATANQRLIDLANQKNGHDNVTVVLVHYQVAPAKTDITNGRPEKLYFPEEPTTKGRHRQTTTTEPITQGRRRIPDIEPITQGRRHSVPDTEPVTQGRRRIPDTEPMTQGRRRSIPDIEPVTQGRRRSTPDAEPITQGRRRLVPATAPRRKSLPVPLLLLGLTGLVTLATGGWLWWRQNHQTDNPLYLSGVPDPVPPDFQPIHTLTEFQGHVNTLAINPQGNQLAVGSSDGSISLWELPSGQREGWLRRNGVPVMGVTFIRNGQQLASFDRSNLEVRSVLDGRLIQQLDKPRGVVTAMAANPNGRFLAVGDANGEVYLWDLSRGVTTPSFRQEFPQLGKIDALAVSPDGTLLAIANQSQEVIELWDVPRRSRKHSLTRQDLRHGIWSLAFRPDGQVLAGGSGDGKVSLWHVSSGAWLKTLKAPGIVYSLAFSPDNALLFSATGSNSPDSSVITVWNPAKGTALEVLKSHQEAVKTLAIAPNGRLVVSGEWGHRVIIWRAKPK